MEGPGTRILLDLGFKVSGCLEFRVEECIGYLRPTCSD